MRALISVGLLATLPLSVVPAASPGDEFVASTPCGPTPRAFLGIDPRTPCERISWQLTLSSGANSGTFTIRALYGMTVPNTQGLSGGGTSAELHGEWTAAQPTTPSEGVILRLVPRGSQRALQLRRLDGNLLHLLDDRGALLVGNGGWSYTLNRQPAAAAAVQPGTVERVDRAGDGDAGVFEGRSPCTPLAAQVRAHAASDCLKLKWRLTLRRDSATGRPGHYTLEGTLHRDRPRTGRWSIERSSTEPRATIVRLDPAGEGAFMSLLKADDNVLLFLDANDRPLIGSAEFSFTLNRTGR